MQKQIEKLQGKLKKERQLNRQAEINAQIKFLRKELEKVSVKAENYNKDEPNE